jgi:tripeptide aminopeptidase
LSEINRELEERLIRYAGIDTQSDENSASAPSTERQFALLHLLVEELRGIGAQEVRLTDYGVVLASIPATAKGDLPVMGWLAHVDTSPSFAASGVKPVVHRGYDGGEIRFADAPDLVLSPEVSPYLGQRIGDDIITASGSTLLGSDDKAGVAIIMTAAHHLLANPGIAHGPIRIAFTPDEEIGRGVDPRLPADLGADFAYTLDGADRGEIVDETFSADAALVTIKGVSIHTGQAKDKLVNALQLAAEIVARVSKPGMTPETTDGRQGFIFAYELHGNAASAEMRLLLRDFELDGLAAMGAALSEACAAVQQAEPRARIDCTIRQQYRNMRYWLEDDMTPVELVREACKAVGIEPFSLPIRGGTDGSRLTEMGVPTPNIFAGMQMIHGPLEWVSVQDMAAATRVCVELAGLVAKPKGLQR